MTEVERVLVQISHPAHVHFYKNFIRECAKRDILTKVVARDKDITVDLLKSYNIEHDVVFSHSDESSVGVTGQLKYELEVLKSSLDFKPDIITSIGGTTAAHISAITSAESVIFTDTEIASIANKITIPFADRIYTPRKYDEEYGNKHLRYDGYHELAYLHPSQFSPNKELLKTQGVDADERYAVVRFIAWGAQHDAGHSGFTREQKKRLVTSLSNHATVYVTSESKLPPELEQFRLPVDPNIIHHLLSFADLYIGESGTMATEAAILGTPSIRFNSLNKDTDMSNFVELEEYGLLLTTPNANEAIDTAIEWITDKQISKKWHTNKKDMIDEKIDVTKYMIQEILSQSG
ncbi:MULTISPECIES: DUF354 domain-containing protein [Haloferax]|uniref:DUF354 domain-containing protein n=1 Tax=Haloferax TaxID=2251 RepID=UPI000E2863F8|nr:MULTISPECIES: DUF354 domain-containing protein [Haloferax]RDZ38993.1 hypothetical protein C5B89_10625 [Haloferax sp. Atlit-47N]WEL30227.1 hypothetical protein HBNXHx_2127 [Haloferax alexandrinus]